MAIDTVSMYHPAMKFPLWMKITTTHQNSYDLGNEYEIRIEDAERNRDKGGSGPYNYIHEAVLVGKWQTEVGDIHPIVLGFCGNTQSQKEAIQSIQGSSRGLDSSSKVYVLTFLRKDIAKEMILEGPDIIPNEFGKEEVESDI